jgi:tetratricopeptide (TPR) repeat protein
MLDRAVDLYERYLASHPEDDSVRSDLVTACVFADAYAQGIRAAAPALAVQRMYYPADLLYANSGDCQRAVEMARKSIAPASASNPALYFGPLILRSAGLEEEARQSWSRATGLMAARLSVNDNARTRMWLAMMYAQLARGEDAREQILRGIERSQGGDPWTRFLRFGNIRAVSRSNQRNRVIAPERHEGISWPALSDLTTRNPSMDGIGIAPIRSSVPFRRKRLRICVSACSADEQADLGFRRHNGS